MNLFPVSLMVFKSYIKHFTGIGTGIGSPSSLTVASNSSFVSGLLTLDDMSESVTFSSQISSLK